MKESSVPARPCAQRLREDARRRFPSAGMVFKKYNASVTLSTGATETLIPAGEGIAFPLGTMDTFLTHGAPANLFETVDTVGLPSTPDRSPGRTAAPSRSRPKPRSRPSTSARVRASGHFFLTDECLRCGHRRPPRRSRHRTALGPHRQWRCAGPGAGCRAPRRCDHRLRRCVAVVGDHPAGSAPRRGADPAPGDRIEIGGEPFLIKGEPAPGREWLVWTAVCARHEPGPVSLGYRKRFMALWNDFEMLSQAFSIPLRMSSHAASLASCASFSFA